MIPTSAMGVGDLALQDWVIIDLSSLENPNVFDRHMFGFCLQTDVYQICSKILEETDEYCQTRSRKYFKDGPAATKLSMDATGNLVDFLHYGWRIPIEQVREVVAKHSDYTISDEGKVEYQEIHGEGGIFYYAPTSYDPTAIKGVSQNVTPEFVENLIKANDEFIAKLKGQFDNTEAKPADPNFVSTEVKFSFPSYYGDK